MALTVSASINKGIFKIALVVRLVILKLAKELSNKTKTRVTKWPTPNSLKEVKIDKIVLKITRVVVLGFLKITGFSKVKKSRKAKLTKVKPTPKWPLSKRREYKKVRIALQRSLRSDP